MPVSVCVWPPIPDTICYVVFVHKYTLVVLVKPLAKIVFNLILAKLYHTRKHKKGLEEDVTKKRTRRAQKFQRAVVGATLQARHLHHS